MLKTPNTTNSKRYCRYFLLLCELFSHFLHDHINFTSMFFLQKVKSGASWCLIYSFLKRTSTIVNDGCKYFTYFTSFFTQASKKSEWEEWRRQGYFLVADFLLRDFSCAAFRCGFEWRGFTCLLCCHGHILPWIVSRCPIDNMPL